MPVNKSRNNKDEPKKIPVPKIIIISLLFSAVYFLVIALFSAVALKADISIAVYAPVGIAAGIVSGFLCGFVSIEKNGKGGLLYGGITGTVQGIICTAAVIASNSAKSGKGAILLFFVIVLSSSIGGILKVNRKKRIRY